MSPDLSKPLEWKKSLAAQTPAAAAELAMLNDLQGNILKGHGRHFTSNIFVKFGEGKQKASRKFMASVGHDVTTALDQLTGAEAHRTSGTDAGTFVATMLSSKGYDALGVTKPPGEAFRAGMGARRLKDPAATHWDPEFQSVHAMILVGTSDSAWRDAERSAMLARIAATKGAVVLLGHVDGNALLNKPDGRGIEHFGYVDGRSQPLVLKEDIDHEQANGGIDQWDPTIPLSQLLVRDPNGDLKISFGSYFVFRKLEQDVQGFKTREDQLGEALDLEGKASGSPHMPVGERGGASVVGRFENGTPVTLDGAEVPLVTPSDEAVRNNFDYRDDKQGLKCPFAGHIRKANPRSDLGADSSESRKHLMGRRGIPYGTRTDDPNDGKIDNKPTGGVGLLFMAYQASLEEQFEFTQVSWVNNQEFTRPLLAPGPNTGIDPVIGQVNPSEKVGQAYPLDWNESLSSKPFDFHGFVKMRGGEYMFAPSISFLKSL